MNKMRHKVKMLNQEKIYYIKSFLPIQRNKIKLMELIRISQQELKDFKIIFYLLKLFILIQILN